MKNKLTKIGLSALCGSLAAVTAVNSGELAVTGGATMTHTSEAGATSGNPLGMASSVTFTGNGELDNGTTFKAVFAATDQDAYSSGSIALTFPSMGSLTLSQADGGGGIDQFDDAMPTAWEETDGTGVTVGHNKISGVGASMNLHYKSPTFAGTNSFIALAYSPNNDGTMVNDKASSGTTSVKNEGWDAAINLNPTLGTDVLSGLNIFAGYSHTSQDPSNKSAGTNGDARGDNEEGVAGFTYAIGPVTVGLQRSVEYLGNEQATGGVWGYGNTAYGVSFNVNDNLSISYGMSESKKGFVSQEYNETIVGEAESIQIAYTIGGASIKIAETDVDNGSYTTGTSKDKEATTIALSLAF